MSQRVFVTGANGRVGIRLVRRLADEGARVVGLARTAERAAEVRAAGAIDCVTGDMNDVEALVRGLDGADLVFHLAGGLRGPGRETADRVNHQGARSLVDALGRAGRAETRVVFTSTVAVHGDRSGLWVDGTFAPSPNTRYGRSKADAEQVLLQGARVVVARLAAVYGPGFPFLYEDAIRRGRAFLPGEGKNRTPLIHVDDAVEALRCLGERGEIGGIYPVAEKDQPTLGEFYAEVARRVGGKPPLFWSTHVPSWVQIHLAGGVERLASRAGRMPPITPDHLRLMTASVRMKTDRLEREVGFTWRYPDYVSGLAATFGGA